MDKKLTDGDVEKLYYLVIDGGPIIKVNLSEGQRVAA